MDVNSNLEAEQAAQELTQSRSGFTPPMRLGRSVGRSRKEKRRRKRLNG